MQQRELMSHLEEIRTSQNTMQEDFLLVRAELKESQHEVEKIKDQCIEIRSNSMEMQNRLSAEFQSNCAIIEKRQRTLEINLETELIAVRKVITDQKELQEMEITKLKDSHRFANS